MHTYHISRTAGLMSIRFHVGEAMCFTVVVRKPEGKRHRWEDVSVDWIKPAHIRGHWRALVGTVMDLLLP